MTDPPMDFAHQAGQAVPVELQRLLEVAEMLMSVLTNEERATLTATLDTHSDAADKG